MAPGLVFLTPFEMALRLHRAGVFVPSYPTLLPLDTSRLGMREQRILDELFVQLCDAWEWQVQRLYERSIADGLICEGD